MGHSFNFRCAPRAAPATTSWICLAVAAVLAAALPALAAGKNGSSRPEPIEAELGEAGVAITPWLRLSGQAELEWTRENRTFRDSGSREQTIESFVIYQLEFLLQPRESSRLELLLEYDSGTGQLKADEAGLVFSSGAWQLKAGKFYTPLGRYWSEFINGPLLEFGETGAAGISAGYAADGIGDLSLMLYQGEADSRGAQVEALDWAASLERATGDRFSFGLSYQSDLADSDHRLLTGHDDRFAHKVAAVSGYARWTAADFAVTLEALAALDSFAELDADRDRPVAWNLELTHPLAGGFGLAWRLEGSRELEDGPELQAGLTLNWRLSEHAAVALEYLHGRFKRGLAVDDDEHYRGVDTFSARLIIGF